ncbi:MAG TPA: PAS domain S-box protein [Hyphomicrobiaceae bacterium]|jgi:PAS domain S-box-containing protein|nr:PAS domain S-box protein [Hyphomicrobiaceae bacterium]
MTSNRPAARDSDALKLKAILESAVAAIITIDASGRVETVNPAAERMFGYAAGEVIGRNISMLMPEPYRSQHDAYLAKYLATGKRQIIGIGREVAGLRKDGSTFPMHLSVGEFAIGSARFFTGTIVDLSAQRAAEQRFEREQALFRAIFESMPDPLVICDTSGAIRLVNPSFTRVFGYAEAEVLGESMARLFESSETWEAFAKAGAGARRRPTDASPASVRFRRKSGEVFPAETVEGAVVGSSGSGLGCLMLIHDATAERQQEALLLKAQRLEAVGQLTGGVAHDFNNLLTVILGNIELLEPKLRDELSRSLAAEAREAAEMGARLTDRLLTFARRQRLETQSLNLNEFVLGLIELLRRTIGAPIDLSTSLAPDLWPTMADPGQVESAVLNLVLNARDAMPSGGRLVIETFNATVDAGDEVSDAGMAAGDYVVLSVADTGHGMPPEVRARAFEPFFTTKGAGKGSGLGLATIYGFARQSGGNVTIYSEAGKGTTVNLYLPRAGRKTEEEAPAVKPDVDAGRGETVLIVEDDDRVRRLTATRLKELGYRVLEANHGAAALAVLAETPGVEIVFSDLVMPGGMSGFDLARRVRESHPQVHVILTSGYSAELMNQADIAQLDLQVLRKPYRQAQLACAFRAALSRPEPDRTG